ncbi:MAG: CDP-alcohol phosphatidyltransferase family protein [Oceanicola sp.]|nr:CDP-alcohol phosphatidyltransferase family protein [Oceanicola sp.]
MTNRMRAFSVHLLTATGAVFAMLALLAAVEGRYPLMFLWLVVALVVDGVDGPLARKYDVQTNAPRVDGALLDLIIDYLTYVFIPAYALFAADLLPGWMGWAALLIITFASAIYFADTTMKTNDYSFEGFPGCWNMVVVTIFALEPPAGLSLVVICALSVAMFLPLRFVHPVRTARWRPLTLPIAVVWVVCAAWAAANGFDKQSWAGWLLTAASLYLLFAGIAQQLTEPKD